MDPKRFENAVNDMKMPKEEHNAWKMYGFLDKDEGPLDRESDVTRLKKEREKILQQNNDISAGLEKVETLLTLQTDIEKENR